MKIVCVGGGPAGLFFAALMRASGDYDVTVLERNPEGVTHGWGVVFWDDLVAALEASDKPTARAVMAAAYEWRGQTIDVEGRGAVTSERGGGYSIARQSLIDILTARARELGVVVRFGVEASQADVAGADLVVASDGAGSEVRHRGAAAYGPEITVGQNKYVWLGTTKVFDHFTFAFVHSEAGWLWCHAYAYAADRSTFIVECAPHTWQRLGFDTATPADAIRTLEALFAKQLDGHPLLLLSADADRMPWLTFRRVRNDRWIDRSTVLVGDAAHTTHFSIGSGTKLAMEDAIELATLLHAADGDVETASMAYEMNRESTVALAQRDADYSARWLENVPRYVNRDVAVFEQLWEWRRSRLLARIPPAAYVRLRRMFRRGEFGVR